MIDDSFESISTQITEIEEQLRLIEEQKTKFVDDAEIPLQLLRAERKKRERLDELRAKKEELGTRLSRRKTTSSIAHTSELLSHSDQKLKVLISSTSEDLKVYRAEAYYTILQVGWFPEFIEDRYTVDECYEKLKACDLVVLLVAFQRGWVPTEGQGGNGKDSITALELTYARENKIPVLIFLAQPENWPPDLREDDNDARAWVENFRSSLTQIADKLVQIGDKFEYEKPAGKESAILLPDFRARVNDALASYKEELLKKQTPSAGLLENFRVASARLLSRNCIPFLGSGVYGQGPLSTCFLRKALGDESCQHCDPSHESCQKSSLATVAEFYYPSSERNLFLPVLKKIIDDQVREATIPPVYDLVKQIKPPLIVSANLDLLLETTLWDGGKQRCLILCHAIRSRDKKGILVFKGPQDKSPQVYPANAIPQLVEEENKTIEQWDYIVYKPLGSPQLPSTEIDTVVITEEDYQILLKLLGSTETGVPAAFITCFRNYPPIFLGYPMDVWHYRLMGQFFKSISLTDNVKFAVGLADLPLEQKAWKGLNVNLVSMDLNKFSQEVKDALQKSG